MDERPLPEGMLPLPFPSFPPLTRGKSLHYRSGNTSGGSSGGGGGGGGGGGSGR